jgi:sulfur-carrier protein
MNIAFSGTLLRFVNFQKSLTLDAPTVEDALAAVATRFPMSRPVIYDGEGRVRQVHQIFLNGKQLSAGELATAVSPADRVDLLTAIAGG